MSEGPSVIVIAGPNGSGKSTAAPILLDGVLGLSEFVNADVIARGLSAFNPEESAVAAGRIMLERLKKLGAARQNFAFGTTLASRSFAPWIANLVSTGYEFHLVFLWLASPELAVQRVAERVLAGGHRVPDEVIRRRYKRGLANFLSMYKPLATSWRVYDNSKGIRPRLITEGRLLANDTIVDANTWQLIKEAL